MATDQVQACAGAVQAIANAVDAALHLGNTTLNIADAVRKLKNMHSSMEEKRAKLATMKDTIKDKIRVYFSPRDKVDKWLSSLDSIILKADTHTMTFNELKDARAIKLLDRLNLIAHIEGACTTMDQLINEGESLEGTLLKSETMRVIKMDTGVKFPESGTLKRLLDQIITYLEDPSMRTVRIYGAPGTVTELLLKQVNNCVSDMFDIVIWVPTLDFGSDKHDNYKALETIHIQHVIAKRLSLNIEGDEDVDQIASKIRENLSKAKYLLLMEDVKASFKLDTIGMPCNTMGSKVIFTTCVRNVRPSELFFNVELDKLNMEESWKIFKALLSDEGELLQENMISIARKVSSHCDGLFSVLKLVARSFKSRRSLESWNDGYKMLSKSSKKARFYAEALQGYLNFSFDKLGPNEKICFLFTILYPKESLIPIDNLFDAWKALDLVRYDVPDGYPDVTCQDILNHLLDVALVQEDSSKKHVTIDTGCRTAAMEMLKDHLGFNYLVAQEALERLQDNGCIDVNWMSLANYKLVVLPTEVNCPKLTTLFLQQNLKLKTIYRSFFNGLTELRVLNLNETGFEAVIPLSVLKNLKVLYVNVCQNTKHVPLEVEGTDSCLEILEMRGVIITEMPDSIKRLKRLRRLKVSIDGDDMCVSSLIICELLYLEELMIDVISQVVRINDISWCDSVIKEVVEKTDDLKNLTTLKFSFKKEVDVIKVSNEILKIYVPKQGEGLLKHILNERRSHSALQVYIGLNMADFQMPKRKSFDIHESFLLCSECDESKFVVDSNIEELLGKIKTLIITGDHSVENLNQIWVPNQSKQHISGLLIQKCNKIVTVNQISDFSKLSKLVLSNCCKLKEVFSKDSDVAMSISHLEIHDCPAIEEINVVSASGVDILPALAILVLRNLETLEKINSHTDWPSLSTLKILHCPLLKQLTLKGEGAKNLRAIKVEKIWWENLQLDHDIKQKFGECCSFRE